MLSNFQIGGAPPFQAILLGQPQFQQMLARPELEQLRQRVIAAHHLGPLGPADTKAYVEHRLRTAGWTGDPAFSDGAQERIFRATDGVPRRINLVCGRLMMFGFLEARHQFEPADVDAVVEDMEADRASVSGPVEAARVEPDAEVGKAARLEALEARVARHDRILRRLVGIRDEYGGEDG